MLARRTASRRRKEKAAIGTRGRRRGAGELGSRFWRERSAVGDGARGREAVEKDGVDVGPDVDIGCHSGRSRLAGGFHGKERRNAPVLRHGGSTRCGTTPGGTRCCGGSAERLDALPARLNISSSGWRAREPGRRKKKGGSDGLVAGLRERKWASQEREAG
uniref:Uncharacterized protein n=1 Tax=Oryza meridionalis TaxID=40149 RepID=A0A0E0DAD3_9ORYZ